MLRRLDGSETLDDAGLLGIGFDESGHYFLGWDALSPIWDVQSGKRVGPAAPCAAPARKKPAP